ncbi:MAG: Holliday junction branch migration protein RuvA [Alphaproteobacteria bacterium]|nr:Holliday junction branch migration protein RuvA [Alphaproteobacteria bacterium]
MIGKLSGIIDSFDTNSFILDVSGVGYVVHASGRTLSTVGQKGDPTSVLITTIVREDAFMLYGFADVVEKQWFTLLTSVQGVGAKAALAILSACPADQLSFAIASQDKAALTQADGVGPKLATRILTELKDKAAKIEVSMPKTGPLTGKPVEKVGGASAVDQDAVSALTNLGYGNSEAYKAVMQAKAKAENDNLQDLIRLALKELSG